MERTRKETGWRQTTYPTVDGGEDAPRKTIIIDTDVVSRRPTRPSWRSTCRSAGPSTWGLRHGFVLADLVRVRANAARTDTWPKRGGLPGSDPGLIAEQLLDRYDLTYAIADMIRGRAPPAPARAASPRRSAAPTTSGTPSTCWPVTRAGCAR